MSINDIKFKAGGELPELPSQEPQAGSPSVDTALAMKQKVEEALAQIEEAEKFDQYYSAGEKAKLEKSKALLMANLQVLEYFLKTGEWVGTPSVSGGEETFYANLDDIEVGGWYVFGENGAEPAEIGSDETITVPKSKGGTTPLTFIMTSSPDKSEDMVSIEFKNKGDDIIATVTFADGHTESQIIKDGAIRPDIQIAVNGLKSEHAIKVDASEMLQIDKLTGKTSGVFIIGTKYDGDVLIGSAGDKDSIHGAGGSDYLNGFAGNNDEVYGYAGTVVDANGNLVSLADVYGAEALGKDGNDTIVDLYGTDSVEAGGGGNDTVIRGYEAETPDLTAENEITVEPSNANAITEWFNGVGEVNGKGEYEIDADNSKIIDIAIPDGYMASAIEDDNDLVLTFVKETSVGEEPVYYTVRISDYFNQEDVTLGITGSFIDMHEVNVGLNTVNIHGTANDGDILIGPETKFDEFAITAEDLGKSTYSDAELTNKLTALQSDGDDEAETVWDNAEVQDGEIVFADASKIENGELDVSATLGAHAFVQKDENDLLVTVVSNEGKDADAVVIRIKGGANNDIKIKVNKFEKGYVFNLGIAIGGVTIDGGDGVDLVMGYEKGSTIADPEGIKIKKKPLDNLPGAGYSIEPEEEKEEKIEKELDVEEPEEEASEEIAEEPEKA